MVELLDPKDAKTEKDYMRISFEEEDNQWREEQQVRTLTLKEQKKMPREVLSDDWQEDMSIYEFKEREYKARKALESQLPKPRVVSKKYRK